MATFRKLRDGSWGVLVSFTEIPVGQGRAPVPGTAVTVTKRDGSRQEVVLGEMVSRETYGWLFKVAPRERAAPATTQTQVGSLSGILALFERARAHLRHPAIVLSCPAINETIRVSMAGVNARVPGSLNVTAADRFVEGRRAWFGRVLQNGTFEQRDGGPALAERLQQFAANPAQVAAEHGRLTGRCCFCGQGLSDGRSTTVGYGPICADKWGLPWGDQSTDFIPIPASRPINNGEDDGLTAGINTQAA